VQIRIRPRSIRFAHSSLFLAVWSRAIADWSMSQELMTTRET